jgi:GNAT superfamily N-acetyltransferase
MSIEIEYLADHPKFVPQIARWYFDEWGYKISENSVERIAERLYAKLNREQAPIPIVAITNRKLIGTAQLKIREMDIYPDREFWLGGVYVDFTARRRGVAKLLVQRIEQIAKQLKIRELFLQTEKLTGGLYAELGWLPIEQIDYHGVQVLIMHKEWRAQE